MANVKNIPPYDSSREVPLSSIEEGHACLLKIKGTHSLYIVGRIGNTPLVLDCPDHQPNKNILIMNLNSGRIVNKHPLQVVVPVHCKMIVRNKA